MPKYLIQGSYTADSWARMIKNPKNRTEAIRKLLKNVGGKLEAYYLVFGEDDFVVIADVPSAEDAAALSIGVVGSGAFKGIRTHELIDWGDAPAIFKKAKKASTAFEAPGA